MAPKVVVYKAVASQPLINGLPGGQLLDFSAFPELQGQAVAGVYRNLGTEPEFDVTGYPEHEYKYVTDGELAIVQDGKRVSAVVGDLVYIPAGSSFRILPTIFTAVYFSARKPAFTSSKL
ncbi:hypothetical protein Rhopal_002960-T1 [Rhodotorula paludigena]|uniref:Cupin 2 conserved barrel domain-containing protein n=1 Tax=Rhodotorula paludigena TaxID=86838 RepID=A0AAV5GBL0_9BASI|nr:hypothetical protein Rhopal_002960-T1 [Rhodotorula paludigena]